MATLHPRGQCTMEIILVMMILTGAVLTWQQLAQVSFRFFLSSQLSREVKP